jgi:carbohydrate diacid regulator
MSADTATRSVVAAKGDALTALGPAQRDTIAETVAAFVDADLNVARCAEQLGLNQNTIRYRLRRIADLTGRDPRRFADALELLCILRAGAA